MCFYIHLSLFQKDLHGREFFITTHVEGKVTGRKEGRTPRDEDDERTKGLERIKKKVKETLRDTDKREKENRKSVKDSVFLLW